MVALMVAVAELKGLALDVNNVHFFRRRKADIGGFAGSDVADDALHESAKIARRAVLDFENYGRVSVVADSHSFAEVVCCWHKIKRQTIGRIRQLTSRECEPVN